MSCSSRRQGKLTCMTRRLLCLPKIPMRFILIMDGLCVKDNQRLAFCLWQKAPWNLESSFQKKTRMRLNREKAIVSTKLGAVRCNCAFDLKRKNGNNHRNIKLIQYSRQVAIHAKWVYLMVYVSMSKFSECSWFLPFSVYTCWYYRLLQVYSRHLCLHYIARILT